jgi:tetratricopeptide (TPR) repeat protein
LGYHQEALDSFDRAVSLKLNEALYWSNRGNALRQLGQLENALASYHTALSIDPSHSQSKHHYTNVLQAIEHHNAVEISPRLQSVTDLVRTVRDGNPFVYDIKDLYPDEDSYRYITTQSELFENSLPDLIYEYGGKYIIFEDGRVIDSDESEDILLDRIWDTDFIKDRMGINGHGIYCHLVPTQLET